MSIWQLATRSLLHFRRTNLALLAGIAIATAVLTGALIVGDSVRGSLKKLTLERLGLIDEILIGQQFFRDELASSLAKAMPSTYSDAVPAILVNQATIELTKDESTQRAQSVTVLGVPQAFWALDTTGLQPRTLDDDQIVVNQVLAEELNAQVGDKLILRIGKSSGLAADSPLARKDDLVQSLVDLELVEIVPAEGLARFNLQASQQIPANAFLSLRTLQAGLDQDGKANAIFVASKDPQRVAPNRTFFDLKESLRPSLADLGLSLKTVSIGYEDDGDARSILEYQTLINDRMLFSDEQSLVVEQALSQVSPQSMLTYMSTKLQRLGADGSPVGDIVPYSTITAVDSVAPLGPLVDKAGQAIVLQDNEIALNDWTASAMGAKVGETIRVTYFEPESSHSEPVEVSKDFVLREIVPITEPDRPFSRRRDAIFVTPPTLANDPDLTPEVEGITDAESIDRWDAPFPMDRSLISGRDDDYWLYYRTTPKAFVSKTAGQQMWASRFGSVTSFRIPTTHGESMVEPDQLASELASQASAFHLTWIRAKLDGIQAAKGTTPFDALFLGFSQFIIVSALILVALLLRLSLEQRAKQIGLLQAVGFDWNRTFWALFAELSILVAIGGLLGILIGIGYAWLMLTGLQTWWVAAIVTPFMELIVTRRAIAIGLVLGAVAALATMALTLRGFRHLSPAQLMVGSTRKPDKHESSRKAWVRFLPVPLLVLASVLGLMAPTLTAESQGGAFFGAGTCVLTALLVLVALSLQKRGEMESQGYLDLPSLAYRNLTRNPTRSTLTIGLVAAACFLIIAISAFRLSPTDKGTGGFAYVGTSDQPLFTSAPAIAVDDAGGSVSMLGLRLQDGDDASCRNLFQSRRPRLIGVTEAFIARGEKEGDMQWAGTEASDDAERENPWRLLKPGATSDAIPVVIDKSTAMYGMQIYTGVGSEFERDYGDAGKLRFRIVGLLGGSIFQGSLLIPEDRLLQKFPRVAGYRYFLVDAGGGEGQSVASMLEERFSDEGLDLTSTTRLLTELLAVQNTYLSTFQSLGGLGLLLGTLGLSAVQIRNVVQRRRELALMQATGFRTSQLSALVMREHALLLLGGLFVGTIAALVVVLPHLVVGGASVPFVSLLSTLALVVIVGIVSAVIAQRSLRNTPLLSALREE